MGLKSFIGELRRRHVFRVAAWYAVAAWLVIQIAVNIFPHLLLPDWSVRLVIVLCLIGFPIAIALAWALEITPEGLKLKRILQVAETQIRKGKGIKHEDLWANAAAND
jgi:hypothetical protein